MSHAASSTGPDPPRERQADSLREVAAELFSLGLAPADVERQLVEQGFAADSAAQIVGPLAQARAEASRVAGRRHMSYGALWCIGGAFVALLAYQSSVVGPTAGRYALAGGAVAIGVSQFLWGLWRLVKSYDPR